MNRVGLDLCVAVAKIMAVLVAIGAFISIYNFGMVGISGANDYLSAGKQVINWPVIFGSVASAIYAVLFAAMMSAARHACFFAQDASVAAKEKS